MSKTRIEYLLPRDATEKEIAEGRRKLARGAGSYSVHPRYTGGSGAAVDEATAERVGEQERSAYLHVMDGLLGEDERKRAQTLALRGVVELLVETTKGWLVLDYLTGLWSFRPFGIFHPTVTRTHANGVTIYTVYARSGETLGRYYDAEQAAERMKNQSVEDFGYTAHR